MNVIVFAFAALVSQADTGDATEKPQGEVASGLAQEGVTKAKFNEIERGFWVKLPIGMLAFITPVSQPQNVGDKRYFPGLLTGLELGYDLNKVIDIGGYVYFAHTASTLTAPVRDLATLFGGLQLHLNIVTTKRVYFGVRIGGGYGYQDNKVEPLRAGAHVLAGLNLEYYTRLRHFSVGLDASVVTWFGPFSLGITAVPNIKYTF